MTSRIPPSRRDPEFAPQRAAKVVQAQTPGAGRVAQAAPVLSGEVAALLRGKASPAPTTDGPLGYCEVDVTTWDGALVSFGGGIESTALTISREYGVSGVSVAGGEITYYETDSLYLIGMTCRIEPTTNAVSTDTHRIHIEEVFTLGNVLLIGTYRDYVSTCGLFQKTSFGGTSSPVALTAACTGGTNRSYTVDSFKLFIARFPPATP